jgi:hypothetical protein
MSSPYSSWLRFASLDAFSLSLFMLAISVSNRASDFRTLNTWGSMTCQPTREEGDQMPSAGTCMPQTDAAGIWPGIGCKKIKRRGSVTKDWRWRDRNKTGG